MGCQTRTDENINHTRYFNTWTYLKRCQHLNSDIHKFQACSSVFFLKLAWCSSSISCTVAAIKIYEHAQIQRTCRPHPSLQASAWWTKRARKTGDVSLRSNDDTIVPNDLNRHDRKQLPRLSLCERLSSPACVVSWASDVLALLQCQYIGMIGNSYWASRFTGGSVVKLVSMMVIFSLHSNIDSIDACSS